MLENLEILQFPDERLRRLSQSVVDFDQELNALAEKMLEIMYDSNGIGLAAPQVNQTIRLIVVDVSEDRDSPRVFVNPKIMQPSGRCLLYTSPSPRDLSTSRMPSSA